MNSRAASILHLAARRRCLVVQSHESSRTISNRTIQKGGFVIPARTSVTRIKTSSFSGKANVASLVFSAIRWSKPLLTAALLAATSHAQTPEPQLKIPKIVPVPPLPSTRSVNEPTDPPARDITDARDHLTFHLPAGWNVTRNDGEVSTFRLDARTAPRTAQLRMVGSIGFNPYPLSTFSGAMFYLSSTPRLSTVACEAQTSSKPFQALTPEFLDDVKFARGKDEHGNICTESRDVAYTTLRNGACLRFDLAIHSFCGGEVSGAQDLTEAQLGNLYARLRNILDTIQFTK